MGVKERDFHHKYHPKIRVFSAPIIQSQEIFGFNIQSNSMTIYRFPGQQSQVHQILLSCCTRALKLTLTGPLNLK